MQTQDTGLTREQAAELIDVGRLKTDSQWVVFDILIGWTVRDEHWGLMFEDWQWEDEEQMRNAGYIGVSYNGVML